MRNELSAFCTPEQRIMLEWVKVRRAENAAQEALQVELYKRHKKDFNGFLFYLGFCNQRVPLSEGVGYLRDIAGLYADKLTKTADIEILRDRVSIDLPEDDLKAFLSQIPPILGDQYINETFIRDVWARLNKTFQEGVKDRKGSVEQFIKKFNPDAKIAGRVFFHLAQKKSKRWPFVFFSTYSIGVDDNGKTKQRPLIYALSEYDKSDGELRKLLSPVIGAAQESDVAAGLLEYGLIVYPLRLTAQDAHTFLKDVPFYEKGGILCRVPDWWGKKISKMAIILTIGENKIVSAGRSAGAGRPSSGLLNEKAITGWTARVGIMIGGTLLTEEYLRRLAKQPDGLVEHKGQFVQIERETLKTALEVSGKVNRMMEKGGINPKDAVRMQFSVKKEFGADIGKLVKIVYGEDLKNLSEKQKQGKLIEAVHTSEHFKFKLFPYQQECLNWLYFMCRTHAGACLFDDMRLGKTIEVLALIDVLMKERKEGAPANLIVMPVTGIENWIIKAIKPCCPNMKYYVAHPDYNKCDDNTMTKDLIDQYDIIIVSYSAVNRYKWIKRYEWNCVVLDEAQKIKNEGISLEENMKELKALYKIPMTGTPIENHQLDIWSIMDFAYPGMFGTSREYMAFYGGFDNNRAEANSQLNEILSPYYIRRLKTDKNILPFLPEKDEKDELCKFSIRQVEEYSGVVNRFKAELKERKKGDIKRKGIILGVITDLKQICDHPSHYLGQKVFVPEDSGKFVMLREKCEEIRDRGERVIVFTQYQEMTEPLRAFMETIFKHKGLIMDGHVKNKKRQGIIDSINGDEYVPFLVSTYGTGGTVLDISGANNVILFDRWWNPMIERQAGDRVLGIKQLKLVKIYKFITVGTLEENIRKLLESKTELSCGVLGETGGDIEESITELSDSELISVLSLSQDITDKSNNK